jgi:hypothetical protein
MRRRSLLAALSTSALAGCGSTDGDGTVGSATPTGTEYPFYRQVRAETVDPGGLPSLGLEPSLRAVDRRIDAERTATVELHLANTTSDPVTVGYRRCPPADVHVGQLGGRGPERLHLFRADEWDGDRTRAAADFCWRPKLYDVETGDDCRVVPLSVPAGETLVRTYEVWDGFASEPCLAPGPYEFGETFVPGVDGTAPTSHAGSAAASTATTSDGTTTASTTRPVGELVGWAFQVGVYEAGAASPTSAPSPE